MFIYSENRIDNEEVFYIIKIVSRIYLYICYAKLKNLLNY